jgi:RNA polymerase sigma-70 factor (ECF subfamily)
MLPAKLDMPEELLLDLHAEGCPDALGLLLERYRRICLAIAGRILRNSAQAEDEVQTAYMKAYSSFWQFEGRSTFGAWLKQIVANQCRMHLRTQRRRRTSVGGSAFQLLPDPRMSPEERIVKTELVAVACREARRLPKPMRSVFRMVMIEGKSIRQCGAQLGITEAAVKSRLARARTEVSHRIGKRHGPADGPVRAR